jgi:16S rRNA (cytosine967-C5)-methyltransferase
VEPRRAVTGDKPRDLVLQRVAQQSRRFPDLDPTGFDARFEARDAAFAHAIYDAVIQRWITLDTIIRSRLDKPGQPLDHGVHAALLAATAQLLLLDRVPAYAAINHAVEWTKSAVSPRAGGLVNAVLRRIADLLGGAVNADTYTAAHDEVPVSDAAGCIKLPAPVFRGDLLDRLALATSHPPYVARALAKAFGEDRARAVLLHSLVRPPTTLCTAYADPKTLAHPGLAPHRSPAHRVWAGDRAGLSELLARDAKVWVQDAGSSHAVLGLAGRLAALGVTPRVVVDLCAGQGTKSRQLAAEFPGAKVLATDTDEDRLVTLRATAGLGGFQAGPHAGTAEAVRRHSEGRGADLVLLDVPCSNSGTLARRPEAKYRLSSDQWSRLLPLQREILRDGLSLLSPTGVLVYSTCSIDPAENHDQSEWAAANLPVTLAEESQALPAGSPGDPASAYADGSYWAVLRRKGDGVMGCRGG